MPEVCLPIGRRLYDTRACMADVFGTSLGGGKKTKLLGWLNPVVSPRRTSSYGVWFGPNWRPLIHNCRSDPKGSLGRSCLATRQQLKGNSGFTSNIKAREAGPLSAMNGP